MEKVKASIGHGDNKVEFYMPIETAKKVVRLKQLIRKNRELKKSLKSDHDGKIIQNYNCRKLS